jgi:hypothetical protein
VKKLGFLIGKWAGEASTLPLSGDPVLLNQTEEARYKLDGLIITIEGVGRRKSDGKNSLFKPSAPLLQRRASHVSYTRI